ncbi:hypothetical protein CTI12_AA380530 [Artemisia annua]|uniref:RRM domain-containing protein n=1 Tax=Artemisia annua TaxID=35608 RepID=A0A2U1MH09_ARTAN|nr:hypothetical protein CTI12_AA380530 [Artemisia annua]
MVRENENGSNVHGDNDGWTWVFRMKNKHLHEQRQPINQKPYQNTNKPFTHEPNSTTFYFTNFPTNWNNTTMLEIFKRYGHAYDVYIAGKRNKEGKRFGFCRFSGIKDVTAFEKRLNTICIGTQKVRCNLAHHQRRPVTTHPTYSSLKPNTTPLGGFSKSKTSYVDILTGTRKQPLNVHLKLPPANTHCSTHSLFAELKSLVGASNTHHVLLDQGFDDFTIKYIGGLHLLIKFGDQETVDNALANNIITSHFNSIVPWNLQTRINNRLVWLSISGLPPQLWYPEPFTNIGELYGKVLIQEDCSPRQFNITTGKVCVLTERMDFIQESVKIPFLNETLCVRIVETDDSEGVGENPNETQKPGDGLTSCENSSDSDEDSDSGEGSDDLDVDSKNYLFGVKQRKDSCGPVAANTHSQDGSTSHTCEQANDKYTPFPMEEKVADSIPDTSTELSTNLHETHPTVSPHSQPNHLSPSPPMSPIKMPLDPKLNQTPEQPEITTQSKTNLPPKHYSRRRASSVPPTCHIPTHNSRKKRFSSLRLIDSLNGINGTHSRKNKKKNGKHLHNSQQVHHSPSSEAEPASQTDDISISDSLSKIRRCNVRILARPSPTNSSGSIEINNIIQLGNQIGFDMAGTEPELSHLINKGVTINKS